MLGIAYATCTAQSCQSSLRRRPRRTDSSSNSGCAATRRSAASSTSTAWPWSPDTRATPTSARRYSSCDPVSAADTLNLRCNSATTGRITERFCLSDRTSPSSTSNSSQPIHIGQPDGVDDGAGVDAGAGPGAGRGAGVVGAGELPRASSISAVCRESCHPPWGGGQGVNSIGNVNLRLFACEVLTSIVAITLDGCLSDHAMSFAAN